MIFYDSASLNRAPYSNLELERETQGEVSWSWTEYEPKILQGLFFFSGSFVTTAQIFVQRLPLGPEQQISMSHYE